MLSVSILKQVQFCNALSRSNFPLQVRNCSPETMEKLSENGSDDILAGLSCRGSEDSGNEDIENRWVGDDLYKSVTETNYSVIIGYCDKS